MQQAEMEQEGSNGLRPDALRGISLQELDKRSQGHKDLVNIYLGWLQEHLNDWDLSDSAVFRPQIKSWYASLRFHGYDDRHIRNAFSAWMSNQIQSDASSARRLLVAQEELLGNLGNNQETETTRDLGTGQGTAGVITKREKKIIDVSSGEDDSDVEFLGWKRPDNMRNTSKNARQTAPPLTGANKEDQRLQGTENRGPNDRLKESRTRKITASHNPSGTPPKNYVCDRCGEKGKANVPLRLWPLYIDQVSRTGHFKENCPTNLDPSYDQKPVGGYQCYCCGAREKHLTTLCPYNENPNSVTQQRIRAGVALSEPSSPPRGADHYRPANSQSRKAKNKSSRSMDGPSTYEDQRVPKYLVDADDHRMDPARRALMERGDRVRSPSRPDDRLESHGGNHYSPPREKRGRKPSMEVPERRRQTKRSRRWRERHRSSSRSSRSERGGSAELLPRGRTQNSDDGRLSYWDDGYNDAKISSSLSSKRSRHTVTSAHEASESLEADIQRLFPSADAAWVSDMAGFDVDDFLRELGDCMIPTSTIQNEEHAQVKMGIFDEEDGGQALPTVRLPQVQESRSDTKMSVDED